MFDYYQPPADEIFEDIKKCAIEVWKEYDDTFKYATSKINQIKDIQNIQDNAAFIVAMFDQRNQIKLWARAKHETRIWLKQLFDFSQINVL